MIARPGRPTDTRNLGLRNSQLVCVSTLDRNRLLIYCVPEFVIRAKNYSTKHLSERGREDRVCGVSPVDISKKGAVKEWIAPAREPTRIVQEAGL